MNLEKTPNLIGLTHENELINIDHVAHNWKPTEKDYIRLTRKFKWVHIRIDFCETISIIG